MMKKILDYTSSQRALLSVSVIATAVMLLIFGTAATNAGVPQWLIKRVHSLVVSQANQDKQISDLQVKVDTLAAKVDQLGGDNQQLHQDLTTTQNELQQAEAKLACLRTLPADNATVKAVTGRVRAVVGLRPEHTRYLLVRQRLTCSAT